ncbi:MAG: glycosyl transferase family 2 [Bacteroidetes bacterium]|jgi:glycosyltransferase involved in cell wall biosynthesis|nr:glycosyl transferase family 2 [Bacteroidota bacterium]
MTGQNTRLEGPIAVRMADVDNGLSQHFDCSGYKLALVFFRQKGSIIGREIFSVINGCLPTDQVLSAAREMEAEPTAGDIWRPELRPAPRMGSTAVTVAVCTRNRASLLRTCLESLIAIDWNPLEIIVIDNCPADDSTKNVVGQFRGVGYAMHKQPGLNRARNAAISLARGEIIAFTDDDARVDRNWLKGSIPNFADPMVALVTGITLPAELETEAQIDFEMGTSFIRGFQRRQFTIKNANPLKVAEMGAGANMAIRVSLLGEIGSFDERLDGGTPTRSGGDHDFFSRALASGYRIVYDPSAIAWHYHKRTRDEVATTMRGYGVGFFAWWTKALIERKEFSVILMAPLVLLNHHMKRVIESLFARNGTLRFRYCWAELRGALRGPLAYFHSRLITGKKCQST